MAKIKQKPNGPIKSRDVLVNQALLYEVRDELSAKITAEIHGVKSEVHGLKSEIHEVKSEIHGLKSEIHEVKSEVHGLKSEIHEVKSEVHGLKSEIHGVKSEVHGLRSEFHKFDAKIETLNSTVLDMKAEMHRWGGLIEAQHAESRAVIDSLTSLFNRQDRCEQRIEEFQATVDLIKR